MRSMKSIMRIYGSFLLALVFMITGQGMAIARAQIFDANGEIIICTGTGVQTVAIDMDGNEIQQRTLCPDCVISDDYTDVAGVADPVPHQSLGIIASLSPKIVRPSKSLYRLKARGPPLG
ncbi:MAG: hypothetical protein ACPGVK_09360 [Halocynthiibacter sp.]